MPAKPQLTQGFGEFAVSLRPLLMMLSLVGFCSAAELPLDHIKKLADDEFKVREAAQQEVLNWARQHKEKAPSLLLQYWRDSKDPEVRARCMNVFEILAEDAYAMVGQGYIGIKIEQTQMFRVPGKGELQAGVRITSVEPGLAGDKAGLRNGDLVFGVNGKGLTQPANEVFVERIKGLKPRAKVTLQLIRDEQVEDAEVTLVRRPLALGDFGFQQDPKRAAEAEKRQWEQFFQNWKEKHDPGP